MNFKDRAYTVFAAGVVATVLHAVDDAFLQPQPGTSPLDHLSIGLVALAVGAVSLWAYRRVRPGTRALLALTWSLTALVSGVEALYYSQHGGMSGDDYSGLVAMASAPLLAGLGVVTLWKSRRLNDRLWRRYTRRSLKAVLWVALAALWVTPFAIAYIGGHVSRSSVPPAAALGTAHEDITLRTSDGLRLEGWYVPSRNGAAVIVFPGRKGPLTRARMLARHGFGVLLFDRRGESHSEGDPDSWGWDFNKDIGAGIDFLKHRSDVDPHRIAGIGLSVGGEMMLQTASERTDLAAVVAEGAGARTASEEVDDVDGAQKILTGLSYGMRDLTNIVVQGRRPPENLKRLVPKIAPRPVFFIHAGPRDVGALGPDYYRAAHAPKQIWEARGGHTQAFATEPREYERRVVSFLRGALLRGSHHGARPMTASIAGAASTG
jgi:poly(3-hydroxybutyrate) depolymerase